MQKLQGHLAIAALGDIGLEDFALLVDGAPKIMDLAIDADKHFIQMPAPLRPSTQMPCSLATDLGRKDRTKTVPPISHRLMAHIDPAFVKQILNIAERERKTDIQHHRKSDNLGRGFEIAERIGAHVRKLRSRGQALKCRFL